MTEVPTIADIEATKERIAPYALETPALPYFGTQGMRRLDRGTRVSLKLELLQHTGSFKLRGALNVILNLSDSEKRRGIVALSSGNHAISTAYAANLLGTPAKVVLPRKASPHRIRRCTDLGAEIILAQSLAELLHVTEQVQQEEGRALVHSFEGPRIFEGTATVGWEFCRDVPDLDAVIVPIGGGGLIAGIGAAIKQVRPRCAVFGVEPKGAQGMKLSLAAGAPLSKVQVDTIADSIGTPFHTPGAFSLVQRFVEDIVTVEDAELVDAMKLMFSDLKLAVEPAGAAAMAAILGPLKARLSGKHVGLIVSGTNIDPQTFADLTQ